MFDGVHSIPQTGAQAHNDSGRVPGAGPLSEVDHVRSTGLLVQPLMEAWKHLAADRICILINLLKKLKLFLIHLAAF